MRAETRPTTTSITSARRALAHRFHGHGIDTPEIDARVLIGHALSLDHAALAAAGERALSADEHAAIQRLADRRLSGEPIARIVGTKEFWGLPFAISPAVLVPRPDSETVVEAALAAIDAEGARSAALRILDIGTGSGALLLALLSELPNAHGVGTDVSPEALAVAQRNARKLGLASRAAFVSCNFAMALARPFDLVVSNPPYVATGDLPTLAPEVRDHDPIVALDGGADGLAAYRIIAAEAARLIQPRGHLVLELGAGQANAVRALFAAAGVGATSKAWPDLAGIARALHIGASHTGANPHGWANKKTLGLSPNTY
jgi:release factor glutamine methyltransferase